MFYIYVSAARVTTLCAAVLAGLVFTGVGRAAANPRCTVLVQAGQSIQSALDGAQPGSRVCVDPGTYQENLVIAKNGITLAGAGAGITILEPPAAPAPVCLVIFVPPIGYENLGPNGICVANLDEEGDIIGVVNDVRVTGFTVQGFPGVGIVFAGANRFRADHNVAADNASYGITAFASMHGRFDDNTSYGSADAGFYIGNSPTADLAIQNNTAYNNLWGILVRDAAMGSITGNRLHDNCSGLVFLNTGTRTGVHHWQASHNIARHNNHYCPTDVTGLPFTLTGLGVLIAGADHIVLQENMVHANQPSGDPTIIDGVALAGGIVVVSTANVSVFPGYYGSVEAQNNVVNNVVLDNQLFDLAYDGQGAGNHFISNTCRTTSPAGLCQ